MYAPPISLITRTIAKGNARRNAQYHSVHTHPPVDACCRRLGIAANVLRGIICRGTVSSARSQHRPQGVLIVKVCEGWLIVHMTLRALTHRRSCADASHVEAVSEKGTEEGGSGFADR